jgi:hypothetical protein
VQFPIDSNAAYEALRKINWESFFPTQDSSVIVERVPLRLLVTFGIRYLSSENRNVLNNFLADYILLRVRIGHEPHSPKLIVGNGSKVSIPSCYDSAWASDADRMLEFMAISQTKHGSMLRVIDQLQWIIWRYKR